MSTPTTIPPGGSRGRIFQSRPRQPLAPLPTTFVRPPSTPETQPRISTARKIIRYLDLVSLDLLFMALFASLMGALAFVPNFKTRSHLFPMWIDPGTKLWVGPVKYSYPWMPFILSTAQAALVDILVPVATILLMQIWVRSFWDANAVLMALFKALIIMTLLQQILKTYIGGLRPYFLSICQPSIPTLTSLLSSLPRTPSSFTKPYHRILVSPSICTTPTPLLHKHLALASFPSGHAGNAFAAATILSLYLNAKLKAFAESRTSFWKQLAVLAPLIGAALVAGNEHRDHHHHVSDILAGIALGSLAAAWAYRAHYASIWDWRNNHIPLPYASTQQTPGDEKSPGAGADEPYPLRAGGRGQNLAVHWPRHPQPTPSATPPPAPPPSVLAGPGVGTDGPADVAWQPSSNNRVRATNPHHHFRIHSDSDTASAPGLEWPPAGTGQARSSLHPRLRSAPRVRSDGSVGLDVPSGLEDGTAVGSLRRAGWDGSMRAGVAAAAVVGVLVEGEMAGAGAGGRSGSGSGSEDGVGRRGSLRWV